MSQRQGQFQALTVYESRTIGSTPHAKFKLPYFQKPFGAQVLLICSASREIMESGAINAIVVAASNAALLKYGFWMTKSGICESRDAEKTTNWGSLHYS